MKKLIFTTQMIKNEYLEIVCSVKQLILTKLFSSESAKHRRKLTQNTVG